MTPIAIAVLMAALVLVNLAFRRKAPGFRFAASALAVAGIAVLFGAFLANAWKTVDTPRDAYRQELARHRQLHLVNGSQHPLKITLKYTSRDVDTGARIGIEDHVQLGLERHNNTGSLRIPASTDDGQPFPTDFSLEVKDELNGTTDVMDQARFLARAGTLPKGLEDKRAADAWLLEVE